MVAKRPNGAALGRHAGREVHLARHMNEPRSGKPREYADSSHHWVQDAEHLNGNRAPLLNVVCPVRPCAWSSSLREREAAVTLAVFHMQTSHPVYYGEEEVLRGPVTQADAGVRPAGTGHVGRVPRPNEESQG